jgi:radical SAM superfamily enzyme YgiQ (UPF0313 family)
MLLINSSPQNALKIFQPFLPIFVPIGLGYLTAACREQGVPVNFIDEQVEEDVFAAVARGTKDMSQPYIFGFSVLTAAMKQAMAVSKKIKAKYPDSIILFGGIHPTANPEEVLSFPHIDLVLRGEAEQTLVELYRHIKAGQDYSHLGGLSYRNGVQICHNPISCDLVDLDTMPPFPYELFTNPKYNMGFVISSRGCPYNCIFCSNRIVTGKRYRYLSEEHIVSALELLHNKYGQTFALFLDDNFLVSKKRIYNLLELIKRNGLHNKMSFSFQARGDNVDYRLLKELYEGGFKSVFFGIETASEEIMKLVNKGETVQQCIDAVMMAKDIGFHVSATFIFGLPTETHADRLQAIRLARRLPLDQVRFNNATPYPGTELYNIAQRENRLHIEGLYENFLSVGTFIENPVKKTPFSYVPPGNNEEEIRSDILFAYLCFYLNPKKLGAIFTKPKQGVGWFNSGESLKQFLKKIPSLGFLFMMLTIKFSKFLWNIVRKHHTQISLGQVWHGLSER